MKKTIIKLILMVSIIAVMLSGVSNNAQTVSPLDAFDYRTITGTVPTGNSAGVSSMTTGFTFNEGMLLGDSREFSSDLAKVCISLSSASYDRDNMETMLNRMGFTDNQIEYNNYDKKGTMEDNDFVAYCIATKEITYQDETYCVYVVPVRGTNANAEWFSDFNLGTTGEHEGFYKAFEEVFSDLVLRMQNDRYSSDKTIVLTTGHSRGAAVANIIAGVLTDDGTLVDEDHIFGYTYACPSVSKYVNESYTNIYNFNNPGDLIPALPKEEWGYKRYGQSIDLSIDQYRHISQRFNEEFSQEFVAPYTNEDLVNVLSELIYNEEAYHNTSNQILVNLVAYYLGGSNDVTLLELLVYLGFSEESLILNGLGEVLSLDNIIDVLSNGSRVNNDYVDWTLNALEETEPMSDEEFEVWLANNSNMIIELENYYETDIAEKSDIYLVYTMASGANETSVKLLKIYEDAEDLLNADTITGITHGHMEGTYVLWINSMYYGYEGWKNNDELISIEFSALADNIGQSCFENCSKLNYIDLYDEVRYIGPKAFYQTAITYLDIPNNTVYLDTSAFGECESLTEVSIPCDFIHQKAAFLDSAIESIIYKASDELVIKDRIKDVYKPNYYGYTIEYSARKTLKEVYFDDNIKRIGDYTYYTYDIYATRGILENVTLPDALESIGDYAFYQQSKLTDMTLPDNVTVIEDSAFEESSITSINIPESLETIGNSSFKDCVYLDISLTLHDNIVSVGESCFENCSAISSLTIEDSELILGANAFKDTTGMNNIIIPCDITYTASVFDNCGAKDIHYTYGNTGVLTDRVSTMDTDNFYQYTAEYGCRNNLESISFDKGITHIGNYAFYTDDTTGKISSVDWPDALKTIGTYSFKNQQALKTVSLPEHLVSIGAYAFDNNRIVTLVLPESLVTIEDYAFNYNIALKGRVTLKANVSTVGTHAFDYATLEELEIMNSDIVLHSYAFANTTSMKKAILPCDMNYYYEFIFDNCMNEEIHYTKGKTGRLTDREYSTGLVNARYITLEFETVPTLKKVSYEEGITYIGTAVYWTYYSDLEKGLIETIEFPSTLKEIANDAFRDQGQIKELILPEGLEIIGNWSFAEDTNIETLVLPETLKSIGEYAFAYCENIKGHLYIPLSVDTIYRNAFAENKSIEELTIENYQIDLNSACFASMTSLKKVNIPAELTDCSASAFDDWNAIEHIHYTLKNDGIMIDRGGSWSSSTYHGYALEYYASKTLKKITMDEGITHIATHLCNGYSTNDNVGYIEEIILPSTITSIGEYAFRAQTSLKSIDFPVGLKSIGMCAFDTNSSLTSLDIPETVETIGSCAFKDCTGITGKITIPASCTTLDSWGLAGCSHIEELEILNSKIFLGSNALRDMTSLNSLTLPIDIKLDVDSVIANTPVEHLIYIKGDTGILEDLSSYVHSSLYYGDTIQYAIKDTLVYITFSEGITSIGDYAFYEHNLKGIYYPSTLEYIGENTFTSSNKEELITYGYKDTYASSYSNQHDTLFINIDDNVSSMYIEDETLSLDDSKYLDITINPKYIFKPLTFTSSNEDAVTITNAKVTAVNNGTSLITISSDNEVLVTATITVGETQSILSQHDITINKGEIIKLAVNNPNLSLEWSSSDDSIVSVENGVLTAHKPGTVHIIVTNGNMNELCKVQVLAPMTSLEVSSYMMLEKGTSRLLEAIYEPADTTDTLQYTSSDEDIVSITQDGTVTALDSGTATITITSTNGHIVECNVEVIELTVNQKLYMLNIDDINKLDIYVNSSHDIVYTSDNEDVIKVEHGIITAVGSGKATITISTGIVSKTVEVVVEEEKTDENVLVVSEDTTLSDTVIDQYVYIEEGCILTVEGEVTFEKNIYVFGTLVNEGVLECEETVYCLNYNEETAGEYTYGTLVNNASLEVNNISVTDVYLPLGIPDVAVHALEYADKIILKVNETKVLDITVLPQNATDKTLTYTSSDENIVSISDHTLTALTKGNAVITVTAHNGISKTINITVLPETLPFSDVYSYDWYNEYVEEAYYLGLMSGATDTLFKPTVKMNRGMVAIVLHRMEGAEEIDFDTIFPDVKNGEYYAESVIWAKSNGVINGYGDGTFRPLKQVTREEMAQMIYNFAKYKNVDVSAEVDLTTFLDGNKVSAWHKEAMMWANANGLITGKYNGTKLDPQGTASRAECCKMLVEAYKTIYK